MPSRRLGLSLGVDLLVPKTCTYDCVFCEVGRTSERTLERREYAPVAAIVSELEVWRKQNGVADYITVAGSGEPTLHSRFGEILDAIGNQGSIPSALLTNGALLYRPDVRAAARKANLVKVSLSAWDAKSFAAINHPHPDLTFETLVQGLQTFRDEFQGEYWLEVVLVAGLNDDPEGVKKIAGWAEKIRPDRIHLNTVVRPPAFSSARAVAPDKLEALRHLFRPVAEVIATFETPSCRDGTVSDPAILAMVGRRPCTLEDLAGAFGADRDDVAGRIRNLLKRGSIRTEQRGGDTYYRAAKP